MYVSCVKIIIIIITIIARVNVWEDEAAPAYVGVGPVRVQAHVQQRLIKACVILFLSRARWSDAALINACR